MTTVITATGISTGTGTFTGAVSTAALSPSGLIDTGANGQIKFPATQNPSSDANTLDDYEKGTWTPSVGGTATYTTQNGKYIKVGGCVSYTYDVKINAIGSGATTFLTGLPFTSNATHYGISSVVYFGSAASSLTWLGGHITPSGTQLNFDTQTAAGVSSGFAAVWGNGTEVIGGGLYFS